MAIHSYAKPSVNHVPEYQLSGMPFCQTKSVNGAGSFEFPRVTRWLSISSDQDVKIFFKSGNATDNDQYFTVPANTVMPRLELRCAKLYVSTTAAANISVIAGLTNVLSSDTIPESNFDWIS
jgi:hypothetical protein